MEFVSVRELSKSPRAAFDKLATDGINAEIAAARAERKKKNRR
jgi:hypothetical protein